jgi:diguanylate cyclase (GGDEF)-like protein
MSEGQILALIQRVISTPTTFTTQHRKKNGSVIDVEINAKGVEIDGKLYLYASSRDITERKLLEDKIKSMAFFDALTNLPNRRLLGDRLNQALATATRSMKYGALMFIDLDNFKPLNDSAGHDAGDLLLIEVGRRLTDCMRQTDTVARVGGDEFVALASEIDGDRSTAEMQAERIAEKIRVAIAAPYVLTIQHAGQPPRSIEHNCTASIGVVLFPQAMGDTEDYLKWADAAMYEAKESGRNRVCVYQP